MLKVITRTSFSSRNILRRSIVPSRSQPLPQRRLFSTPVAVPSGTQQQQAATDQNLPSSPFVHVVKSNAVIPKGLFLRDSYLQEDTQAALVRESRWLLEHVKAVRTGKAQPIEGLKYDQFVIKSSNEYSRTILNIFGHNLQRLSEQTEFLTSLAACLKQVASEYFNPNSVVPNAVQINYYSGDSGCPMHVDAKGLGKTIAMFSLESETVMSLAPDDKSILHESELEKIEDQVRLLLRPGTLLVLQDGARYEWLHGIKRSDSPQFAASFGQEQRPVQRGQNRISIVFWKY